MKQQVENLERMKIISENITYYRKAIGMTQKELAEKIGVTPSTLSDYINLRSAPSFGVLQKLADTLGVKKSDIDTTFKVERNVTIHGDNHGIGGDNSGNVTINNTNQSDESHDKNMQRLAELDTDVQQELLKLLVKQTNLLREISDKLDKITK